MSFPSSFNPAGTFGVSQVYVYGYASTTWLKSVTAQSGNNTGTTTGTRGLHIVDGFWNSTAAINRVTIFGNVTANLAAGSQLRIYGIL